MFRVSAMIMQYLLRKEYNNYSHAQCFLSWGTIQVVLHVLACLLQSLCVCVHTLPTIVQTMLQGEWMENVFLNAAKKYINMR